MNQASPGGGSELQPLLKEIEKYLGELMGNLWYWERLEQEYTYFNHALYQPEAGEAVPTMLEGHFKVPGTFGFTITHEYLDDHRALHRGKAVSFPIDAAIQQEAEEQWHLGVGWAEYCASSFSAMTRDIWEPDVAALTAAVNSLDAVTGWTYLHSTAATPAFVTDLKKSWPATSLGSASFYHFWNDVADLCAQYSTGCRRLTVTASATTAAIEAYRQNLVALARGTRDHLVATLQEWQRVKAPVEEIVTPKDAKDPLAVKILDGVALGADLVGIIPGVDVVSDPVGWAATVIGLGLGSPTAYDVKTNELATASDIRMSFRDALEKLPQQLRLALDKVQSVPEAGDGGLSFSAFVTTCENNPNWTPPAVDL